MTNNLADRCEAASGADAKAWECFQDSSYYDMWCVCQVGDRTFGSGFHLMRGEEATALRDLLNQRADAQGEAVAWMYEREDRVDGYMCHISLDRFDAEYAASQDYAETPLFRHPPAQDVEALVEALEYYAHELCELGPYTEACGKLNPDNCGGCRARQALAKHGGA